MMPAVQLGFQEFLTNSSGSTLTLWFLLSPSSDKFPLTQICALIESGLQDVSPGQSLFLGWLVPMELAQPTPVCDGKAPQK